jgi:cell surface protein SprA
MGGDLLGEFGNLGINLTSRLESKYARSKNERCTTAQLTVLGSNCLGGFIPSFDFQFNVRTGGVVAERMFMNVDYDSQREFEASNNISVFYQGKTDEVIQKLEFGNVSFQPPPSRYLTSGIPSGNYGVQATGQFGPMRFTSIVAQQKGNVSKDNVFTVGGRTQQTVERPIQDTDIEPRRFFFTVDPRQFRGYPNVDLLNRQQMVQIAGALPDSIRPTRVYLYRQLIGASNQNPRGPRLAVRGARIDTRQTYEVLRENVDYFLDPSQLWIALVRPLNPNNERLAIAYEVLVNGAPGRNVNTGGTPDIEVTDAPQFANLLWEPELQPDNAAYFFREIKSVYRLGGEDLLRQSVTVKLVTGTSGDQEKPIDPSRGETYLQLFGLSQATNPTQFDVENRVWPRPNDQIDFAAGTGGRSKLFRDYFIFFPSVQPFARAGLAQPAANPANDTLYRYPNEYLYSSQRPQAIYRMITRYFSEGGGEIGTINLSSIQLRANSERVVMDGRTLERGIDYTIDYDLGAITFSRPDTLFPVERQVTVRYEENPLFASAPTNIFGFASQFQVENGQFAFTAISQQQRSSLNRPPLGFEPIGSLVAGVTGNLTWDAGLLTRAVGRILPFGGQGTTPSRIALQGEFAMSKPQPNAAGQAYVESFEGESGVPVSLSENAWYFSSVPSLGARLTPLLGGTDPFALNRAATVAYQSNGADGSGRLVRYSMPQIDPAVRITGNGVQPPEPVLFMTLYPLRIGGVYDYVSGSAERRFAWTVGNSTMLGVTPTGRRWRSLRTVLNPSGADLSRIENIEFFVQVRTRESQVRLNPTLVLDFGEISENSVAFAPETLTVAAPARPGLKPDTTYQGKRLAGYNRFDSERDPFSRAFNALENDRGLPGDVADTIVVWDRSLPVPTLATRDSVRLCSAAIGILQTLGDSRANCTAGNNRLDEEDIDLDGTLNSGQEQLKRFVVDLSKPENWTRRGGCQAFGDSTGVVSDSLCWVQIRLNWRAPLEELNSPNDRRMRAMRLALVSSVDAPDDDIARIGLARFRLVGAPWLKRSDRPLSGAAGDSVGARSGYVVASTVGTLDSTRVVPYTPPPGVAELPEQQQSGYENNLIQVNERALRLQAGIPGQQFRPFDRAEAFFRFPEGTKTFMGYRTLRLWMRGNKHGWGQNGELNGYVKIGRDEHNFYMYRTPVNEGPAQSAWDPEIRVDLTRFQTLRAQLENNFLTGSADSLSCTGTDLELVRRSGLPRGSVVRRYAVCQDGYIVYSADPSVTPPNLAGVQELAVGFVRVDSLPRGGNAIMADDTLELWINDIRLSDVVDDIGFAGELGLSVNAADLADFRLNISRRDPNFRQLGETPSFLTTNGVSLGTTLHLDRMLPARLGLVIPFNVDYAGAGIEQLFINRTDVRGDGIAGLRNPRDSRVNYSFAVRRALPLTQGWYRGLVNGLSLNGSWGSGASQSAFQEARVNNYTFNAGINLSDDTREGRLPGVIDWLIGALPRGLRESASMRALRAQRVRWTPTLFTLSSGMARVANSTTSYTKAAESPTDTGQTINGLTHFWQNNARLQFAPLTSLNASFDARQLLDLREYRSATSPLDSTDRSQATAAERLQFLGTSVGLERERSLISAFSFQPVLALWLRPSVDFNASFNLSKDPNARSLLREGDSTGAFRLPKRLGAAQTFNTGTMLDLGRLIRTRTRERTLFNRAGSVIAPAQIRWTQSLTSNYDNTAYIPGLGYQFGLGSLESFRGLDNSRLATTAGRVRRLTTSGGINLPLSLSFTSNFEDGTSDTWTRRSLDGFQAVITTQQRVFPDHAVRWSYRPARLAKLFTTLSLNAQYRVTEQQTIIPNEIGGLADQSLSRAQEQPINGSITWAFFGNLMTSASMNRQRREDLRPGSITTADTKRMSVDLGRQFTLPKRWNARGALRTRLSYQSEETRSVVGGATTTGTVDGTTSTASGINSVLTNNGRQAFNLNADTELSELLSFSLTGSQVLTYDRSYNRRVSNTVFSAILQLRFFAGEIR